MPDDWEGFPLRKDYPVQIKQPVKTYEPLQVSQDQFVANIEATQRTRAERLMRTARCGCGRCRAWCRRSFDEAIALHQRVRDAVQAAIVEAAAAIRAALGAGRQAAGVR